MAFFFLKPEVAGNFGSNTIFVDRKARPPLVKKLHYEFNVWMGDPIVETVCCYIVTETMRNVLVAMKATGASFEDVEVSTVYPFEEVCKGRTLPSFYWLKVSGVAGVDDFGYSSHGAYLVVSERILDALIESGMSHCDLVELDNWKTGEETVFRQKK